MAIRTLCVFPFLLLMSLVFEGRITMVRKKSFLITVLSVMAAFSILTVGLAPVRSQAASHREAPLIAQDPTADITDFFMFRSYEPGHEGNIVFILNVIPGEEPSSGPN